ncbi:MAG TPA: ergothioneine biosynthesis protein EgtB [Burkholderiales bacterium]
MMDPERKQTQAADPAGLPRFFADCRRQSVCLVEGLSDADATVQSMDDASPAKWHLAHTTWFFEEFVLGPHAPGYRVRDERFRYLFNSYYEAVGPRHPRPRRGMLTRPSLAEVLAYREHVDAALSAALEKGLPPAAAQLVELGVHHEQQHQELLLTDLLHLLAQNPLKPAYRPVQHAASLSAVQQPGWVASDGGIVGIGHPGDSFNFDCETPRHRALLQPHALSTHLVTNREWEEFIRDGGYREARLWLSDGWRTVQAEQWSAPLYWENRDGAWMQMTLAGELPLLPEAPVCHVSFFEADAYAHWAGKRLPTEFEWEAAAARQEVAGNFADSGRYRPQAAGEDAQAPLKQLYGDVWEWTASPYVAYPGFRTAQGAVGEYNGKFMNGQFVLRGGSCATPAGHARATYRNFFYPHHRWQFMGLRLAEDRK